ncbi:nucleotidyltransferase [Lysinibacillus xylanilyticus]|uniref:nucleotidyltransferase domain-containing protein n=1 Tax=Lysinibacillus xylanilyticus TaxID=582475 RepID=UPI0037F75B58
MVGVYLNQIINRYHLPEEIDVFTRYFVVGTIEEELKNWAGLDLNKIFLSGSRSKGTAIKISSDLDLFISLKSDCTTTLKGIYNSLFEYMKQKGYDVRKQNVSIGLKYKDLSIDLVPSKKHLGHTNYHNLYKNKTDSWTQTNVEQHIKLIKESGRTKEIVLLKIWRKLHGLEFPSMYLELFTLEALKHKPKNDLANNFWFLLLELTTNFKSKRIVDPSNSNNIISNDLTESEKNQIVAKAIESTRKDDWKYIIW